MICKTCNGTGAIPNPAHYEAKYKYTTDYYLLIPNTLQCRKCKGIDVGQNLYATTVHVGKVDFEQPIPDCAYANKTATNEIACFQFFADKITETRVVIQMVDLDFFVVNCLQMLITIKDIILQHNE